MRFSRRFLVASGALSLAAQPTPLAGRELRVAACQILTFPDTERSAEKICAWIEKAAPDKADVVLFPEAAVCGYTCEPEYWKAADPSDFEAAESSIVSAARRMNVGVILGTAHWEGGKVHNSVLTIDRDGRTKGRYSKTFPERVLTIDPKGTVIASDKGDEDQAVLGEITLDSRIGRGPIGARRPGIYDEILKPK